MSNKQSDPVVMLLCGARRLIDKPGKWCKYTGSSDGRRCLDVALSDTAHEMAGPGRNAEWIDLYQAAHGLVLRSIRPDACGVVAFNDSPSRTHPEVLAALDKAIALRVAEITA